MNDLKNDLFNIHKKHNFHSSIQIEQSTKSESPNTISLVLIFFDINSITSSSSMVSISKFFRRVSIIVTLIFSKCLLYLLIVSTNGFLIKDC